MAVMCKGKKCRGCWLSFSETPVVKREWTVSVQMVRQKVVHVFPKVYLRLGGLKLVYNLKSFEVTFKDGYSSGKFPSHRDMPVVRDKLKIFVTLGTIKGAVAFSILADIACAPVAFLTLREEIRISISSSVQ